MAKKKVESTDKKVTAKVLRTFLDMKSGNVLRNPGETFELTKERYDEIVSTLAPLQRGKGAFITIFDIKKD